MAYQGFCLGFIFLGQFFQLNGCATLEIFPESSRAVILGEMLAAAAAVTWLSQAQVPPKCSAAASRLSKRLAIVCMALAIYRGSKAAV